MLILVLLETSYLEIMTKSFLLIACTIFLEVLPWSFFSETLRPPLVPEKPPFTVMIDPAGDARNPGRVIDDTYERSLTMQCAEELKQLLETEPHRCRVILTRFAGEAVEPFQNITFANRLGVNLYISLNFFQQTTETPSLYWYTLLYDPATDFAVKKGPGLELLPYDQAYKLSLAQTKQYGALAYAYCSESSKTYHVQCTPPMAIPYKPLVGIMAPALGIEIGILHKNQGKLLAPLIAQAIKAIATS